MAVGLVETVMAERSWEGKGSVATGLGAGAKAVVDWEAVPEVMGVVFLAVPEEGWAVMALGATAKVEVGSEDMDWAETGRAGVGWVVQGWVERVMGEAGWVAVGWEAKAMGVVG